MHRQKSTDEQAKNQVTLTGQKPPETDSVKKPESTAIPRMKIVEYKGKTVLLPECEDLRRGLDLLGKAVGGADLAFVQDIMWQLASAATRAGKVNEEILSFMMSIVIGTHPRDQLEAMLAAQMAAVHVATMDAAHDLANAELLPKFDSSERALNKLARTYTMQMDAIKRYRSDGEQKVTVQSVSVGEGGQAIVGNVTQNPNAKAPDPTRTLTDAKTSPMSPIIEASNQGIPAAVRKDG